MNAARFDCFELDAVHFYIVSVSVWPEADNSSGTLLFMNAKVPLHRKIKDMIFFFPIIHLQLPDSN